MVLKGFFSFLYLVMSCHPPGKQRRSGTAIHCSTVLVHLRNVRRSVCCGVSLVGVMTALDVAASNMSANLILSKSSVLVQRCCMICMVDVTGGCIRLSVHHCCLLHDVEASRMRFPPLIPPLAGPERSEKMVVCARLAQFLAGRPR